MKSETTLYIFSLSVCFARFSICIGCNREYQMALLYLHQRQIESLFLSFSFFFSSFHQQQRQQHQCIRASAASASLEACFASVHPASLYIGGLLLRFFPCYLCGQLTKTHYNTETLYLPQMPGVFVSLSLSLCLLHLRDIEKGDENLSSKHGMQGSSPLDFSSCTVVT